MVTQEWTEQERATIESMGYVLNFKNYYTKDDLTLSKRLDLEFNELFYQAYNATGMQINIPAYRVAEPFEVYIASINDLSSEEIINLDKLLEWLNKNGVECSFKIVQHHEHDWAKQYELKFNGKVYNFPADTDIERIVLYNTVNELIKNV